MRSLVLKALVICLIHALAFFIFLFVRAISLKSMIVNGVSSTVKDDVAYLEWKGTLVVRALKGLYRIRSALKRLRTVTSRGVMSLVVFV